jgi:flavin-binding protein dodecin
MESDRHTYKVEEIVGTSPTSIDDAMRAGVARAGKTLRGLDWLEVVGIRGHIEGSEIAHFQVTMKVGFRVED